MLNDKVENVLKIEDVLDYNSTNNSKVNKFEISKGQLCITLTYCCTNKQKI